MKHTFFSIIFFAAVSFQFSVVAQEDDADRTSRFRSGTVFSAEISTLKPEIEDDLPYAYQLPANPAWAEIIVKFDRGRTVSVYDFTLTSGDKDYPCYAIAEAATPYSLKHWIYSKALDPLKYYRMLFLVEAPEQSAENNPEYELDFKLFTTSVQVPKFSFRNMLDQPFTAIDKIPKNGLLGLKSDEFPWLEKKETPVPETKAEEIPPEAE